MEKETFFSSILKEITEAGYSAQEFINWVCVNAPCPEGVKYYYADGSESVVPLPFKTLLYLNIDGILIPCDRDRKPMNFNLADLVRREYAFNHFGVDPDKVYMRFPTIEEAEIIRSKLSELNFVFNLLKMPLLAGEIWLTRSRNSKPRTFDLSTGELSEVEEDDEAINLIVVEIV